ncbi:sulfatase-like hydrolase/transferase [Pontiella sp.]|uniref:sulfatase-like hydrolase/transferase n=1 Tax=Pontiella sp. TaxID=2837462 RepID=UPI003568D601
MNRLKHVLLAVAVALPLFSSAAQTPNIVMIMADDLGWGDVGFNGHPELKTPNLDLMAQSGVRFDRFYAAAPLCSPTRGSCLTGRYPFRFGVLAAHTGGMRVGETTVAEMLKKRGYATGFFGKWHLGWVREADRDSRGFYSPPSHHGYDEWFATTSAVPTWDPGITPAGWKGFGSGKVDLGGQPWKGGMPYVHNGNEVADNLRGDDSRVIMDRVIPFIEKNRNQPFLATVWFHTPHEPVVAGEEYKKRYPKAGSLRQNYYGCITAMDEQIGRLRTELRKLGIEKNTVLLFCSDNGPADGLAKKGIASAGPFKGHKHTLYEGGLLVPACAEWPGVIKPGTATDVRCSTVDFVPTIAKLAGYKIAGKLPIDGIDLMPVIDGTQTARGRDLFFGYMRLSDGIDGKALISGDYKLLTEATKGGGQTLLFDLKKDPGETTDLSQKMPERFIALSRKLAEIENSCRLSRDGADYKY